MQRCEAQTVPSPFNLTTSLDDRQKVFQSKSFDHLLEKNVNLNYQFNYPRKAIQLLNFRVMMDFQGVPSQLSSKAEITIVPLWQMKLPQWQSLFLTKNHLEENSTFTKLCDFTPLGYLFTF